MGKGKKILALLLAMVFILASCGRDSGEPSAPELVVPVITQVRRDTAIVTRGRVADVEHRVGIVRVVSKPLNFGPVAAFLGALYVMPGDTVAYGQVLARLDMEQLARQVAQQEERIAQLRREFDFDNEIRRIDLQIERLTTAASPSSLELELAIERQTLQLRHEEADLQALQARYAQSELRAPFAGTIVHVVRRLPGSWVGSFDPVIYIAPEEDASIFVECMGGMPFSHGTPEEIYAHINGEVYSAARLRLTAEQTRGYVAAPIRFALDYTAETRPPVGAFVSLHIYSRVEEDVLRLPRNTLFFNPDMGSYVYRIAEGHLEMVLVSIGRRTETYVQILGGIGEGDEVYVRS